MLNRRSIDASFFWLVRLRVLSRVDHGFVFSDDCARRQPRLVDLRWAKNVHHAFPCGEEVVGDDPSVAAPPEYLGAHDRASTLGATFPKTRQAGRERLCQSVISVISKAPKPPILVGWRP